MTGEDAGRRASSVPTLAVEDGVAGRFGEPGFGLRAGRARQGRPVLVGAQVGEEPVAGEGFFGLDFVTEAGVAGADVALEHLDALAAVLQGAGDGTAGAAGDEPGQGAAELPGCEAWRASPGSRGSRPSARGRRSKCDQTAPSPSAGTAHSWRWATGPGRITLLDGTLKRKADGPSAMPSRPGSATPRRPSARSPSTPTAARSPWAAARARSSCGTTRQPLSGPRPTAGGDSASAALGADSSTVYAAGIHYLSTGTSSVRTRWPRGSAIGYTAAVS